MSSLTTCDVIKPKDLIKSVHSNFERQLFFYLGVILTGSLKPYFSLRTTNYMYSTPFRNTQSQNLIEQSACRIFQG